MNNNLVQATLDAKNELQKAIDTVSLIPAEMDETKAIKDTLLKASEKLQEIEKFAESIDNQ